MARAKGPLGNAPRDLEDDFVGVPAEDIKADAPMRWPPKPKRVTKDTFHSKAEGRTSPTRADRKSQLSPGAGHFRRGGWVSARARGGGSDKTAVDAEFDAKGKQTPNFKKGGALSDVSKHTSKGGLHRSLGIPEGEKIGAARIEAATHSSNPKTRRQANLAQTYAKYRK
jgi:hypothetical protein